jgi:hypothetical protein
MLSQTDSAYKLREHTTNEYNLFPHLVMDLQGPPSERTQTEKLKDLKKLAQQYARDRGSCDNTRISYLEFVCYVSMARSARRELGLVCG